MGNVQDLPEGAALQSDYYGLPLLVLRLGDDVTAVSAMCTHEGCILAWNADRRVILCPCHGGEFDPTGGVLSGPPPAALLRFLVRVEQAQIYVLRPQDGD